MPTTLAPPPILDEAVDYESPWLVIRKVRKRMPTGAVATFFLREEADVAVCLPVLEDGRVVLVEEYRHGPGKSLYEIPGGNVDPGEDARAAAQREVLEETGFQGEAVHLGSGWISAYSNARKHIFLMRGAKLVDMPEIALSELQSVAVLSWEQFLCVAKAGQLTDLDAAALCVLTLQHGGW